MTSKVSNQKDKFSRIHWSDDFFCKWAHYFADESHKIRSIFNDEIHPLKDEGLTYRIVNHWESNGLIDSKRKDKRGWRKFSLSEIIWIHVIGNLRKFGVSIKNIKQIKTELTRFSRENLNSKYPELEFFCATFPMHKEPTYMLVFDDFTIDFALQHQIEISDEFFGLNNFIRISLHDILQKLYPRKNYNPNFPMNVTLKDEEIKLFSYIRSGEFDEISCKMKDGKITRLHRTSKNIDKKLYEILKEKNYGSIHIKQENGKIVGIDHIIGDKF